MSDELDALLARSRALRAGAARIRLEVRERVARARERVAVAQQLARPRGDEPLRVFRKPPIESGEAPPDHIP